jgi:zinc and cadmium transporter
MTLIAILFGALIAGVGSVWLAALLAYGVLARFSAHLLSLAAGALLATVLLHLLPEAFESQAGAQSLGAVLLGALVFFFLLDKAELYHHGHEHHHGPVGEGEHAHAHEHAHNHEHAHPHAHQRAHQQSDTQALNQSGGSWAVILGDCVHAFGDGVLIAAAFMADFSLGVAATLAVLAHEVPHHMGDLVVLRQEGRANTRAVAMLSLTGLATLVGGVVGYAVVGVSDDLLPYLLVVASASFVYVALADLIPQLQKRLTLRQTVAQVLWLAAGIALVSVATNMAH